MTSGAPRPRDRRRATGPEVRQRLQPSAKSISALRSRSALHSPLPDAAAVPHSGARVAGRARDTTPVTKLVSRKIGADANDCPIRAAQPTRIRGYLVSTWINQTIEVPAIFRGPGVLTIYIDLKIMLTGIPCFVR